jgi:hypothetical protein
MARLRKAGETAYALKDMINEGLSHCHGSGTTGIRARLILMSIIDTLKEQCGLRYEFALDHMTTSDFCALMQCTTAASLDMSLLMQKAQPLVLNEKVCSYAPNYLHLFVNAQLLTWCKALNLTVPDDTSVAD